MDDLRWTIARQIPHLRRYAISLTRNRDEADDLVQDCLERALRKRHLWRRRGSLRSWLFRILYRTYIDHHRRRAPLTVEASSDIVDRTVSQPPDQEPRIDCRNVAEAMDRLPDDQRAVILLVALEGLSYDEVADVLGVPIGTVRSRLSRGRDSLRRLRAAEETPPPRLRRVK